MPDQPGTQDYVTAVALGVINFSLWAIYVSAIELKVAFPFMGITGAAGMVYGVVGAIKEYEEIMCAIDDQAEITDRVMQLTRDRFNRWKGTDLPYVLETQAWSLGLGWYKPSCGSVFSKWNSYASRAANASIGMDSRWRDRWRLGDWPNGGQAPLSGIRGTLMVVAHVSVYKSMLDNYYDHLGYKDQAIAAAAGASYANEAFNESSKLLQGAAMGYNHVLGLHAKSLGQYVNTASQGSAMMMSSNKNSGPGAG